jgi:hypothetical protein
MDPQSVERSGPPQRRYSARTVLFHPPSARCCGRNRTSQSGRQTEVPRSLGLPTAMVASERRILNQSMVPLLVCQIESLRYYITQVLFVEFTTTICVGYPSHIHCQPAFLRHGHILTANTRPVASGSLFVPAGSRLGRHFPHGRPESGRMSPDSGGRPGPRSADGSRVRKAVRPGTCQATVSVGGKPGETRKRAVHQARNRPTVTFRNLPALGREARGLIVP